MRAPIRFLVAAVAAAGVLTLAADDGRAQKSDDAKESPSNAKESTDDANSSGSSGTAPIGGETPEETFKMVAAAIEKEDWKGFSLSLTKESQDMMAGSMAFVGMMMHDVFAELGGEEEAKQAKAMQKVLDKHGLNEAFLKKLEEDDSIQSPEAGMKKILVPIKNRPQFIGDMMAAMKELKSFGDNNPFDKSAKLKDVIKVDGDSAKATIEFERDGKPASEPVAFKKIGGKWLMDISEAMKAAEAGPPGDLVVPEDLLIPEDLPSIPDDSE